MCRLICCGHNKKIDKKSFKFLIFNLLFILHIVEQMSPQRLVHK